MIFVSIRNSAAEAKDYFTRALTKADYYTKDMEELPGQWHGYGAELLKLKGEVTQKDFFALYDNINPNTGRNLTTKSGPSRRVLFDFTFAAPKSVSLIYELGNDEEVLRAHREAVKETMAEMESAMMTRVRKDGADEDRYTSNMIWAEFTHRTSRPVDGTPDPALHTHATMFNATYDDVERKWKASQPLNLYRDKGYYQAAFHSRLAHKLQELGYQTERDGNSCRIVGLSNELNEKFSRRTAIIEAEAERLGVTDAHEKGQLGLRTREKKDPHPKSTEELRQGWDSRLTEEERQSIASAKSGKDSESMSPQKAVDYALAHSFERRSAIPEKELMKEALIQSVGNASVAEIRDAMQRRPDILRRRRDDVTYATTKEVLKEEQAINAFVREGRGKYMKLGGAKKAKLDSILSKEQRQAADTILNSRDRVTALRGQAGTGKTTLMQTTVAAIEKNGTKVFTFAPSAEASRGVLRSEGFKNAETVERLLVDHDMQKTVKDQVLWIDEAGLLSSREMKRLFDVAEQQNARIVLSGDTGQHAAVVRGDALRILETNAGMKTAELKEIRRQKAEDYRKAVKAISEGDRVGKDGRTGLASGIALLEGMGAISEQKGDARYEQIAADYSAATKERKADGSFKSALVVAPTHREADKVTEAIRTQLMQEGRIDEKQRVFKTLKSLNYTEAQRTDPREYKTGSVIQFHQNARGYRRGERASVTGVDSDGVHVTRADGSNELLPLGTSEHFQVFAPQQLSFAKGDRIRITQNGIARETRRGAAGAKQQRLNNGSVYEIEGFTKHGDIKLVNGFVVPKDYGHLQYGLVSTSISSQGKPWTRFSLRWAKTRSSWQTVSSSM